MAKIHIDRLALETFGRVFGVKALLGALDKALPEAEWQERKSLRRLAEEQHWDYSNYDVECQVVDEKFRFWVPRFAAYSVISLLQSVVETQLFACADRLRSTRRAATTNKKGKRRGLERARQQLKAMSGFDVATDSAWPELLRLEKLRNLIVHQGGSLGKSKEDRTWSIRLAETYKGKLWLSDETNPYEPHVILSMRLCTELADLVYEFFRRILPALGFADRGVRIEP